MNYLIGIFALLCLTMGSVVAPPTPFEDGCLVGVENRYVPSKLHPVPEFDINLDLPPYQRWQNLTMMYKSEIVDLIAIIKNFLYPIGHGKIISLIDKYMGNWNKKIGAPFHEEMMGIANATGIPLGEIVLYNLFYELHSMCTSIVARGPDNKLYHGRNLDFGMFLGWNITTHTWLLTDRLRDVNVNIRLMKGGKLLANQVTFVGFLGTFNGMKKDHFTLTMNTRFDFKHGGLLKVVEWLLDLTPKDMRFTTFLAREVLENDGDFLSTKLMLMSTPVMAPCFYIIAGAKPNQGAIIARSPTRLIDLVELGDRDETDWYLLQTNYDPQKQPLYLDDRRTPGHACMNKLGQQNVSLGGLFNVLSSKTTLNKETAFTVLMQINDGTFETYTQHCPDPCWFA